MTKNKSGVTLIEVLIVVAILGILAAIAIPSYTKYITSSRRADGQVALLEAAQIMERYFTNNNTYVGATIGDGTTDLIPETSEKEYYLLSFPGDDNPSSRAFTIRATAQNEQSSDADCEYLEIDQLGRKTSHPSDNCW